MKKLLTTLTLMAVACSQAAIINFGAAQNISGDSDVSTNGDLVWAFSLNTADGGQVNLNGVDFQQEWINTGSSIYDNGTITALGGSLVMNSIGTVVDGLGSATAPFTGLSANYQAVLSAGSKYGEWTPLTTEKFSLSKLTLGQEYEVQIWVNHSAGYFRDTNKAIFSDTDSFANSVTVDSNTQTGETSGLGQYVIATFTADSVTQDIWASNDASSNLVPINAIQLRAIPEPATLGLLLTFAGALLAARRFFLM
jgi:hypothetical protein